MASIGYETVSRQNLRSIIDVVRTRRAVSRRTISRTTGLSAPTVTRHVAELLDEGILEYSEDVHPPRTGPGRPAHLLTLAPDYGLIVGVDVGERTIRVAVGNFTGELLATERAALRDTEGAEHTLASMTDAIRAAIARAGRSGGDRPRLRAIAIGVPGIIDSRTGTIVDAPNIRGWRDYPLGERVLGTFGADVSVRVENDVNIAAVGEFAVGVAQDHQDFVFVSVRTGIGAGVFLGGTLLRGRRGMAGELGFMAFDADFDFDSVGGLGHLETVAGEQAIVRKAVRRGFRPSGGEAAAEPLSMRDFCLAAREGDAIAMSVLTEALDRYGVAVANITSLLDPDLVVIGGDLAVVADLAVERIGAAVGRLTPHEPRVLFSSLGEDASLRGAFHFAHLDACATLSALEASG